jgi:NADH dehydrogenase
MLSALQGLALTRIGFGLYFLVQAFDKTARGWLNDPGPMTQMVQRSLEGSQAFYRPFLEDTVIPNAALFAQLVTIGEWAVGLCLTLGLFTRAGALLGLFLVLNYMLMKGLANPMGSNDRLFAAACLAFTLAPASLAWGLDGALRDALSRVPVLSWLVAAPAPARRAVAVER